MRFLKTALAAALFLFPAVSHAAAFAPVPQELDQPRLPSKKSTDLVLAFYQPKIQANNLIIYAQQLSDPLVRWIETGVDGRQTSASRTRFVNVGESIAVQDFPAGMTQAMELLQRLDKELFQPTKAGPEVPSSDIRATVRLSRLTVWEAEHLLRSTWPRGLTIGGTENVEVMTLYGPEALVNEARALIETADRPLPQVLLHWSLIEAVKPDELGESEPVAEEIFNALTALAPRKAFRRSGDFFVRGIAGGGAHLEVESETGSLKGTTQERPGMISLAVNVRSWKPRERRLNLTDCAITIRRNTVERLTTDLSITEGETTVIGSIGSDQLFVALSVSVIE